MVIKDTQLMAMEVRRRVWKVQDVSPEAARNTKTNIIKYRISFRLLREQINPRLSNLKEQKQALQLTT